MGDFPILKRNDLLKIKGCRNPRVYFGRFALNQNYCMVYDPKRKSITESEVTYAYDVLLTQIKEVHRPTPDGIVQVWPEEA